MTTIVCYAIVFLEFFQNRYIAMHNQQLIDLQNSFDKLAANSYLPYELAQIGVEFRSTDGYFKLIGNRALEKMTLFKSEAHYGFVLHIVVINHKLYLLLVSDSESKRNKVFKQAIVQDNLYGFDKWLYLKRVLQVVTDEFCFVVENSRHDTYYGVSEMMETIKAKL